LSLPSILIASLSFPLLPLRLSSYPSPFPPFLFPEFWDRDPVDRVPSITRKIFLKLMCDLVHSVLLNFGEKSAALQFPLLRIIFCQR